MKTGNHRQIVSPDGLVVPAMDLGHIFAWCCEAREKHLTECDHLIIAAIGRPTAPVFAPIVEAMREYWTLQNGDAIEYGPLTGVVSERSRMARALSNAYGVSVDPDHIVFTVGGHHALAAVFSAIRQLHPSRSNVVSFPVYPAYRGWAAHPTKLICVDVMPTGGQFTADALAAAVGSVPASEIGCFTFCSPNNPCGYIISKSEWEKIALILKRYPEAFILLDEAYMEMSYEPFASLFSVAPELHDRIILIRSATKGFSASGERMAVAVVGSAAVREKMREYIHESTIHTPISGQYAYSRAMEEFDESAQRALAAHYQSQVKAIVNVLEETGLNWKHPKYSVAGTFYVLADFSRMRGMPMHPRASAVFPDHPSVIADDVHVVFHLLFQHGLAFAPMSLYGCESSSCLLRITCSSGDEERHELINRLRNLAG